MDNDLVSIYENAYLRGRVIEEKKPAFLKEKEEEAEKTPKKSSSKPKGKLRGRMKKSKKSMSKKEIGAITYDSHNRTETVFDKILREMNEMGGGDSAGSVGSEDDNVFDTEDYAGEGEEEQTFTLSELRGMTLGELVDMLGGDEESEDLEDEFAYEDYDNVSEEDDIPTESYGFTGGEGNYQGSQGNYDGKAKRQAPTSHVKANGDADFSDAETDYDPEEVDGNEESNYKGDQGNYDGKAKRQAPTSHVKANGDADFGKAKTAYKTQSGKKDKNYF